MQAQLIRNHHVAAGLAEKYAGSVTLEQMVEFLGCVGLTAIDTTRLFEYANKKHNGSMAFEQFVDFICGTADDAAESIKQPSQPKSEPKEPEPPLLKKGDVVRVVKDGDFNGRLATVLDPSFVEATHCALRFVKVQLRLEDGGAADEFGAVESFSPSEVSLEKLLEVDLQEQLEILKAMAYKKMDLFAADLEDEQKKREEAEGRAKLAEERASRAEERAQRAEQALEDERKLASLADAEQRQKAAEELKKKREEEEAERNRLAEEEDARCKAEQEARLREEEELRRKAQEEADEAARLRAEKAALDLKALGASRTRLKVTVVRAEGLRAGDIGGLSDPYCIVHVRGQKEDAQHPPFTTDIKKQTLTPHWDQEHTFDACTLSNELLFEVWDHDEGTSDDALGSAILTPSHFRPNGFDAVLKLGEKKQRPLGTRCPKKQAANRVSESGEAINGARLFVKVEVLPMLKIDGMPRCFVNFQSASNLRAADRGGKSDPYVIVEVPGKPMSRFRTAYKSKTLNPEWAEETEICEYAKGDDLQLQVFDHDLGSSLGDPLGSFLLRGAQIDPDGFNGPLTLEGKGALANSTLTVVVDVF